MKSKYKATIEMLGCIFKKVTCTFAQIVVISFTIACSVTWILQFFWEPEPKPDKKPLVTNEKISKIKENVQVKIGKLNPYYKEYTMHVDMYGAELTNKLIPHMIAMNNMKLSPEERMKHARLYREIIAENLDTKE